jgi:hypothetical protein
MTPIVNINYIVASIQSDLDDFDIGQRLRLQQKVIEAIADNNIFNGSSVEVRRTKMSSVNKIALPSDYVKYTKIACEVNGVLWTLGRNDNMAIEDNDTIKFCTLEEAASTTTSPIIYGGYNLAGNFNGAAFETLYSVGGGMTDVQYRIDEKTRTIHFSKNIPGDIVIEYISTGINNGTSTVSAQAVKTIKAAVHWNLIEYDNRTSLGEKRRKEDLFEKELGKLRHFNLSFTMDEFLDMVAEGYHQGPKR